MSLINDIKYLHRKYKTNLRKIISGGGNILEFDDAVAGNLHLDIIGKGNIIKIANCRFSKHCVVNIDIFGDNNTVIIDGLHLGSRVNIQMGQNHKNFGVVTNSKFIISSGTSIESMNYITYNSNTEFVIEENCMLSFGITVYNTDAHAILDYEQGKLVNYIKGVHVGRHCWIGMNVTIMKNTVIPEDSIVGANSVVSGRLPQEHAIYAGNPAVLVKENRSWDANGNNYGYIQNDPDGAK